MSQNKYKKHRKQQPPWPLIALAAGGLLLIGAFLAFNKPAQPKAAIEVTGAPSLKVNKEKVDLGDQKLGQMTVVSFELSNVGDQPLRFSEAPYIEVIEGC